MEITIPNIPEPMYRHLEHLAAKAESTVEFEAFFILLGHLGLQGPEEIPMRTVEELLAELERERALAEGGVV
ncbi:MAG TPA: hypothetical protein VHG91_00175 [Longimicrobium sp.]|nr:hypothetical protein [Longimicrobium sp.]